MIYGTCSSTKFPYDDDLWAGPIEDYIGYGGRTLAALGQVGALNSSVQLKCIAKNNNASRKRLRGSFGIVCSVAADNCDIIINDPVRPCSEKPIQLSIGSNATMHQCLID